MDIHLITGAAHSGKSKYAGTLKGMLGGITEVLVLEQAQYPTPENIVEVMKTRYNGARFEAIIVVDRDIDTLNAKYAALVNLYGKLVKRRYLTEVERI